MKRGILLSALAAALAMGGGTPLAGHSQRKPQGKPAGPQKPRPEHSKPTMEHGKSAPEHTTPATHVKKTTVSEHVKHNTKLQTKLQGLLPPGTDMEKASTGFKNLGQFVSAAHVSHNLGIPFDQLKTRITAGDDLGEAIHALKPDADARSEARKAQKQAEKDIRESKKS